MEIFLQYLTKSKSLLTRQNENTTRQHKCLSNSAHTAVDACLIFKSLYRDNPMSFTVVWFPFTCRAAQREAFPLTDDLTAAFTSTSSKLFTEKNLPTLLQQKSVCFYIHLVLTQCDDWQVFFMCANHLGVCSSWKQLTEIGLVMYKKIPTLLFLVSPNHKNWQLQCHLCSITLHFNLFILVRHGTRVPARLVLLQITLPEI